MSGNRSLMLRVERQRHSFSVFDGMSRAQALQFHAPHALAFHAQSERFKTADSVAQSVSHHVRHHVGLLRCPSIFHFVVHAVYAAPNRLSVVGKLPVGWQSHHIKEARRHRHIAVETHR